MRERREWNNVKWSVMSVEGFEIMSEMARFSDFGCRLTHGCGMRTERVVIQ